MKIIWTEGAADDLAAIFKYIRQDSSDAARKVVEIICDKPNSLPSMPHRGRKRADGSRELVFAPWPYVAVYDIADDTIIIPGIRHTARNW